MTDSGSRAGSPALAAAVGEALLAMPALAVAVLPAAVDGRLTASPEFCRLTGLSDGEPLGPDALTARLLQAGIRPHVRELRHGDGLLGWLYLLPAAAGAAKLRHDARSPLTAIQVYVECLLEDEALSQAQEDDLRQVLREVRRLGGLLQG